jgi:TonB family protein
MQVSPDKAEARLGGRSLPSPALLVELPAWHRVFFANLVDLVLRRAPPPLPATLTAPFWPDVFVATGAPWRSLVQSALYHLFVLTAVWGISLTWLGQARLRSRNPFENSRITYYSVAEYLPAVDSGSPPAPQERKGEPAYARQRIVSLPKLPDNRTQTIITPNSVRLPREARLPNLVAWTPVPAPVPAAALGRSPSQLTLPALPVSVVAPPPEIRHDLSRLKLPMVAPAVVAPPPSTEAAKSRRNLPNLPAPAVVEPPVSPDARRRLGELNIGAFDVPVAAPELPVAAQRTAGSEGGGAGGTGEGAAEAPPSSAVAGLGNRQEAIGQMLALGLNPAAVNGPIEVPGGSRYGEFAAGPEGKPGAPGTPEIRGGSNGAGGSGRGSSGPGRGGNGSGPAGIYVGSGATQPPPGVVVAGDPGSAPGSPNPSTPPAKTDTTTLASAVPPRVTIPSRTTHPPTSVTEPAKIEDKVFAGRRYYSTTINMPNLVSAGGSWIIRFAELKDDGVKGEVTAPVATLKVDPRYPPDAIREGVEGTVTLYAVIRKDGSVGEVRVLRGLDHRLDGNAIVALSHWHFRPGTKNGSAVDLEAVVSIPFRAGRLTF